MNITAPKIVVDTNILIAAIGRKSPFRWIFDFIIEGKIILCVSNEILFEYREVLERKTNAAVAENVINFILINPFTEKTEIYFKFALVSEDEDDNKFVDCAVSANAVCLISNDNHFQVLKTINFPHIKILTLTEFEIEYRKLLSK